MVRRRTAGPERERHGDDRTGDARGRRHGRIWRRIVEGASEIVGGVVGTARRAPRPVVVPIPVRTTRPMRRRT